MKGVGIIVALVALCTACQPEAGDGTTAAIAGAASASEKQQEGISSRVVVDAANVVGTVSPLIYGAGVEDVNHEIYGGLYDQRIFGESFEEEAVTAIAGWQQYDEEWTVSGEELCLSTEKHGKIVNDALGQFEGTAEVEVRLDSETAIAGFILAVSNAGNGADRFNGHEIALDAAKRHLVFGWHGQNWKPIAYTPVAFDQKKWNRLRVEEGNGSYTVYVNGTKVFDYSGRDGVVKGLLGLRSFGGSARFRRLRVNGKAQPFAAERTGVSRMWEPVGEGEFFLDEREAFHGDKAQVIRGKAGTGIANRGLNRWGIDIEEDKPMRGSICLKGNGASVVVALESADGRRVYAEQELTGIGEEWQRFNFKLTPRNNAMPDTVTIPDCNKDAQRVWYLGPDGGEADHRGRFVVRLAGEGTVSVDHAMLYTDCYPFRQDITEAFIAQGLTFLRYGGCMVNAAYFRVRDQRGPAEQRPGYRGWWYDESSNGFGIPEFVRFARLIGAEPCFGVNVEDNPVEVLEMLKEIERYGLHYIQIGNEEMIGTKAVEAYDHYCERFRLFYETIHPAYPELEFVSAAWWRGSEPALMERTFRALDGMCSLWDYHPWTETFAQAQAAEREVEHMRELFKQWNPRSTMRCAILEENGNIHNLQRGLVHALMLNVVRRTDGFVPLDSPANALQPWLQNDNGWDQGQIFFDTYHAWGQPPFWVQTMASQHHQPLVVECATADADLDVVATRDEKGNTLVLHMVNMSEESKNVSFDLRHFGSIRTLRTISISGRAEDHNTPDDPFRIAPEEKTLPRRSKAIAIKPYSYTVVVLDCSKKSFQNGLSSCIPPNPFAGNGNQDRY